MNGAGVAEFDDIVRIYRDDHLAALRVMGHDAEREAGRLSLDEVRLHLASSVLPRLIAEGIIATPAGEPASWRSIQFSDQFWRGISAA
ncbi:MAG TPA: hypothetical protein VII52_14275, partial [Gemmatimonadaceae bacterium]